MAAHPWSGWLAGEAMTAQRRILASLAVAALARAGVSDSLMSFTAPFNFINPKSGDRTVPNFDVLGHAVVNEEPSVGVAVEFVDAAMVHHQNVYLVPLLDV